MAQPPQDAVHARLNLGLACHRQGRFEEAAAHYEWVLAAHPDHASAWQMLGLASSSLGRLTSALRSFEQAVRLMPTDPGARFNQGLVLLQMGRQGEAATVFERVLALQPDHPKACVMQAQALHALGRDADAAQVLDAACASGAASVLPWLQHGEWLLGHGDAASATHAFRRALARHPGHADAQALLASALLRSSDPAGALAVLDQALAVSSDAVDLWFNRGLALARLQRWEDAEGSFGKAIQLDPRSPAGWTQRGIVRAVLRRLQQSVSDLEEALRLDPGHAEAQAALGHALLDLGQADAAVDRYEQALALTGSADYVPDALALARARLCDWRQRANDLSRLEAAIVEGRPKVSPARVFPLLDRPDLLLRSARAHMGATCDPAPLSAPAFVPRRGRLRIGYFSADFHAHATTFLLARMIELHDPQRVEPVAFAFGGSPADAMQQRLRRAFKEFHVVDALDDRAVARLARERGIHMAIDLKGLSLHARPGIFAARAAPVQAAYLGYPCTTGAPWIDYLIADRIVVPAQERDHYSEKIVALPGSYQANDDTRAVPARPDRAQHGLPADALVFCSLNSPYKIAPEVFDVWMRLLRAVPGSVLWQLQGGGGPDSQLREAARARGVDPSRLVLAPLVPPESHLARLACADLFLDTLPCNAHTSASDALWMGVPLLTVCGRGFAGRVSASLLHAVGLPELVCPDLATYEASALALARDPARLAALKDHLQAGRRRFPLFDSQRFTRGFERACELMWARHEQGLGPEHIDVEAD